MEELSNDLLLRAYEKAVQLELEEDFLRMLHEELIKRGMLEKIEQIHEN